MPWNDSLLGWELVDSIEVLGLKKFQRISAGIGFWELMTVLFDWIFGIRLLGRVSSSGGGESCCGLVKV